MRTLPAIGITCVAASQAGAGRDSAGQDRTRLDPDIPSAIAAMYKDVRDARGWMNPKLTIRAEGIEVESSSLTAGSKTVPASGLRDLLIGLPVADWPYGRVVMASDIGIRSGDRNEDAQIQQNHDVAGRTLAALDVTVEWWPSEAVPR